MRGGTNKMRVLPLGVITSPRVVAARQSGRRRCRDERAPLPAPPPNRRRRPQPRTRAPCYRLRVSTNVQCTDSATDRRKRCKSNNVGRRVLARVGGGAGAGAEAARRRAHFAPTRLSR
ncbi:hypothetical protein EVAR_100223_1 [Eumeta japonica]|uniref:Uncharacterized protein n=1 Tax=Eumeta variegata TaxID=151549 RepID=A0A4C1SZ28_EUMVA|nr:hypothetical protein EVAR_100223_1 [Eumeta japonica]